MGNNANYISDSGTFEVSKFYDYYKPSPEGESVLRQECCHIYRLSEIGQELSIDMNSIRDKRLVYTWRDPWNHFAALLKYWEKEQRDMPTAIPHILADYIPNHKRVLKNALGIEQCLPSNALFINYNEWFRSDEYRQKVAMDLNLPSCDRGVTKVWMASAFDQCSNAQEMRVENRWETYVDDPGYRGLFKDEELVDLASQFYPPPFR